MWLRFWGEIAGIASVFFCMGSPLSAFFFAIFYQRTDIDNEAKAYAKGFATSWLVGLICFAFCVMTH